MTKIFYLHGFNSGFDPSIEKVKLLETIAPVEGRTTDYLNPSDVAVLKESIRIACDSSDEVVLVGTSLGGYFARYFAECFKLRAVLINPAMEPYKSLPLGKMKNFFTGQERVVVKEEVEATEMYKAVEHTDSLTILSTDDEVLDYKVAEKALSKISKIVLTSGGHRMNDINKELVYIQNFIDRVPANDSTVV